MAAIKPVLNRQAASVKILGVIKQIDPNVEEVMDTAAHVALYDFDVAESKWARKEVEGALYVVKCRGQPRFRCIVLNKKGTEDFLEDIGPGFMPELQSPYLLYRADVTNPDCKVIGIWFFEPEDCSRITDLLQRISKIVTPGQGQMASPVSSSVTKTASNYEVAPPRTMPESNGPEAKTPADRGRLSQMFANLNVQRTPEPEQAAGLPPAKEEGATEPKPKPAAAPHLLNPALLLRGAPIGAGVPTGGLSGGPVRGQEKRGPSLASDMALVQQLFRRLAANDALCQELAKELRASGMLK